MKKYTIDQVDKSKYSSFTKYIYLTRYKHGNSYKFSPCYGQFVMIAPVFIFMRDAPLMPYPPLIFLIGINSIIFLSAYLSYTSKVIFDFNEKRISSVHKYFNFYACKFEDLIDIEQSDILRNRYTVRYKANYNEMNFKIDNENIPLKKLHGYY